MAGFDPSVIASIGDNGPDPMAAKGQAYTLAGMMDKQQLNRLQLHEAQQDFSDKNKVRDILANEKLDYSSPEGVAKTAEKISRINPDMGMKFMKNAQDYQTGAIEQKRAALQLADEQQGSIVGAIDPIIAQLDAAKSANPNTTPAQLNAMTKALAGPAIQQLLEARPDLKPQLTKWMQNPDSLTYQGLVSAERMSKQGQAAIKSRLAEHAQETKDKTEGVAQQRADANDKRTQAYIEKQDQDRKDKAAGIIAPEDLSFTVDQYIAGDKGALTGLGSVRSSVGAKNWASFRTALREHATAQAGELGLSKEDAPKWVAGKMAEFEGAKSEERARGTRQAGIEIAATEFNNMLPIARQASAALDRSSFVPYNQIEQAVAKSGSSKELKALNTALQSTVNIYARAINPTGVSTVDAKEHARDILNTADGPEALNAAFDIMQKEVDQAKLAPDQVKDDIMRSIMGKKAKTNAPASGATAPKAGTPSAGASAKGQTKQIGGKTYVSLGNGRWAEQ